MGKELKEKALLSWEIDNFSQRNNVMISPTFSSGGCKWYAKVYPKGYLFHDHLSVFLHVVNPKSLRPGWKRRASFCFALLNQSGKELYRSPDEWRCTLFCAECQSWGFVRTLPLTKLHEKGFLEKNKLTVEVYMKVVEVVHQGKSTANDVFDCNGFHVTASQSPSVGAIFADHPDFALHVIAKNKGLKTAYMNLLLGLIKTLNKSPKSLSRTELSNAQSKLTELTEAGFNLDWLESKLEEIHSERKKALSDGSCVQQFQLEERVKNLELALSVQKIKSGAKVSPFELIDFLVKRFFLSCFSIS
ncbi:unnamed protein product [Microthlaspi erraticum]|uniref:MATH domain-containing protein n=1 Tax=Microthlaspi erraticum TaxID=1685480 RepID=A0A6D2IHN3_9BRAS|nr:unnamed protein product [Microthlaspi erraticum]